MGMAPSRHHSEPAAPTELSSGSKNCTTSIGGTCKICQKKADVAQSLPPPTDWR